MSEQRKFHRTPCTTKTILSLQNVLYHGQLENISMNGALIQLKHGTDLILGNVYDLDIFITGEDLPLRLTADVRFLNFAMAGVKFLSFIADSEKRLSRLIETLSSDPNLVTAERERIRRRSTDSFREE
jgi:hypothetical protein